MSVLLRVYGKPVPQGRPRSRMVTPKNGAAFIHHHQPQKCIDWQNRIRGVAIPALAAAGWRKRDKGERVAVAVFISPREMKRPEKRNGVRTREPIRRGDLDNHAKAALDALQGLAYEDDQDVAPLVIDWLPASREGYLEVVLTEPTPALRSALAGLFCVTEASR